MLSLQAQQFNSALVDARHALPPNTDGYELEAASARLVAAEAMSGLGDADGANLELNLALALVLEQREGGPPARRLDAELMLSRILDAYGDSRHSSEALERAAALAESAHQGEGAVFIASLRRALGSKDLEAARATLQRQLGGNTAPVDLLRGAILLHVLEIEMAAPPDGKVRRVLENVEAGDPWWRALARWALGTVSDTELRESSANHLERMRTELYIALGERARALAAGEVFPNGGLLRVARDALYDEPEVGVARLLVAPPPTAKMPITPALP
jgi:hypothetical protein